MRIFTTREVADREGVALSTVNYWCRTKGLGAKSGRDWVITEVDLQAFIRPARGGYRGERTSKPGAARRPRGRHRK